MCGRFVVEIPIEELRRIFAGIEAMNIGPHYNVAPTQQVWVVRNDGDNNRLDLMKWGLIPFWAKDTKIGNQMINARSETVHEKPAFRHSIKARRCIIPVSGFYEWLRVGEQKQPHYIHMADGGIMAFAGIWDQWHLPGEETLLESFSILTTSANELLSQIHERMPVILQRPDYDLWLDKDMHDPEHLRHLYQPYPADQLKMYRVDPLVNSPRNHGPECLERI